MRDSTSWHLSCEVCGWDASNQEDSASNASQEAIDHAVDTGHSPIIGYNPSYGHPDEGRNSAGAIGSIGWDL